LFRRQIVVNERNSVVNLVGSVVAMEEATQPPTNITHSVMTTAAESTLDFALSKSQVATQPSHPAAAAERDFTLSPLASSLTRSVFHSELKTWLFSKSFPP